MRETRTNQLVGEGALSAATALILCACAQLTGRPDSAASAPVADLLVRGGLVVDGIGAPAHPADLAIAGGRILAIGSDLPHRATEVLDASGLVVAPGFVDVHTHVEDIAEHPRAENYARMGVTTVVSGNCGASALPVGAALEAIERAGISIHYATLVGHGTVRRSTLGTDDRAPTSEELARMEELVERAVREGALGLSTGLQYVPGTFAETGEIAALARAAVRADPRSVYASHMRNEGTEIEAALDEALAVGAAAGCRVQVSHLKLDSQSRWGAARTALDRIDDAARGGLLVAADQYAYTAGSTGIGIRFPAWALEGDIEQVRLRLDDPVQWARIRDEMRAMLEERGFRDLSWAVVASCPHDPSLNGKSVASIAAERLGADDLDAQLEVARDLLRGGGASMVYHFMSADDVEEFMRHPRVGVASDGSVLTFGAGVPHPRTYGNNARVLGHYVRERGLISLEEAVRKMTLLPTDHFGLDGRGRIEPGAFADLVLFDPATVGSPATYERPHAWAVGIPHVLVEGNFVVRDGEHTGASPGRVLRRGNAHAPAADS